MYFDGFFKVYYREIQNDSRAEKEKNEFDVSTNDVLKQYHYAKKRLILITIGSQDKISVNGPTKGSQESHLQYMDLYGPYCIPFTFISRNFKMSERIE